MKKTYYKTEQSVGRVLCHDITRIKKGTFKGAVFKKGHLIAEEDVPVLLDLGKRHVLLLELEPGELHEDEAGLRAAAALQGRGRGLLLKGPSEGRMDLTAAHRGLLKVNAALLEEINSVPSVVAATLHNNTAVEAGEIVAGVKVIPLVVEEEVVRQVEELCSQERAEKAGAAPPAPAAPAAPPLQVLPFRPQKIGVVITGQEVVEGRVKDGFAPVLREKASFWGCEVAEILCVPDSAAQIASSIDKLLSSGCSIVIVTGGMSVDPDDVTPAGIKKSGARLVKYGAPALPGAMFMLAYKEQVPVIGLPACAMYYRSTVLDILMPRIIAGETLCAGDIISLGHGGLCRRCEVCIFPGCSFGKGV